MEGNLDPLHSRAEVLLQATALCFSSWLLLQSEELGSAPRIFLETLPSCLTSILPAVAARGYTLTLTRSPPSLEQ